MSRSIILAYLDNIRCLLMQDGARIQPGQTITICFDEKSFSAASGNTFTATAPTQPVPSTPDAMHSNDVQKVYNLMRALDEVLVPYGWSTSIGPIQAQGIPLDANGGSIDEDACETASPAALEASKLTGKEVLDEVAEIMGAHAAFSHALERGSSVSNALLLVRQRILEKISPQV